MKENSISRRSISPPENQSFEKKLATLADKGSFFGRKYLIVSSSNNELKQTHFGEYLFELCKQFFRGKSQVNPALLKEVTKNFLEKGIKSLSNQPKILQSQKLEADIQKLAKRVNLHNQDLPDLRLLNQSLKEKTKSSVQSTIENISPGEIMESSIQQLSSQQLSPSPLFERPIVNPELKSRIEKTKDEKSINELACYIEENLNLLTTKELASAIKYLNNHLEKLKKTANVDRENINDLNYCFKQMIYNFYPDFGAYIKKNNTISTNGLEILVQYLKDKKSIEKNQDIIVCSNLNDFKNQLDQLDYSSSKKSSYYFVIPDENSNSKERGSHLTPVVVTKGEKGWDFIMTDSIGSISCYQKISEIILKIIEKGQPLHRIYECSVKRQNDHTNCPVFTLRDLVYFCNNEKKLIEVLNLEAIGSQKNEYNFIFNELPPELMKTTQSMSTINNYINNKNEATVSSKKRGKETLKVSVERHESDNQNNLIQKRFEKYKFIILNKFLENLINES